MTAMGTRKSGRSAAIVQSSGVIAGPISSHHTGKSRYLINTCSADDSRCAGLPGSGESRNDALPGRRSINLEPLPPAFRFAGGLDLGDDWRMADTNLGSYMSNAREAEK